MTEPLPPFWMRPETTGWNRLPGRATLHPFPDEESALTRDQARSRWVRCLDGEWAFKLVSRPERSPKRFADPRTDDATWDRIAVPGCWNRQGFDKSIYTNVVMPWQGYVPPEVPRDDNPTGLYRRRFKLPRTWTRRRVVLHLGAVESCCRVWVNGHEVGMAKGSRLPLEFDVTAAVQAGENLLAVQVVRWSDGSYLEDQDHWWMAGIHRGVYLYTTGKIWLEDVFAVGTPTADLRGGRLDLRVRLGWTDPPPVGLRVRARVHDARGRTVGKALEGEQGWNSRSDSAFPELVLGADLPRVKPWSAETPELYTLTVALVDPRDRILEATATRIGFRRVELGHRQLLVNGKPVLLKGVNRHDHHQDHGKTLSREDLRADVELMKRHNVNAVRTSHYPNDPYLYELCDEYGLYVIDEANIECHAYQPGNRLAEDPRWTAAFVDRVQRMVLRDRNHPSIILWSLGNESGYGANHDAAAGWVRGHDHSRLLHYAEATSGRWGRYHGHERRREPGAGALSTDVIAPMYPDIADLVRWAEDDYPETRALIMCEYSHAMGNSNGSLAEYWEAIEQHPGLQGGFIWDWIDQGLRERDAEGRGFWAYGGDFGEEIHDANFCINGLLRPDRIPHPAMAEVAHCYRYVDVRAGRSLGKGDIVVSNRHDFVDLGHLRGRFAVTADGVVVQRGNLPRLRTAPGAEERLRLPLDPVAAAPGQEAFLDVWFEERRDRSWVAAGHEVARRQLPLPVAGRTPRVAIVPAGAVDWDESDDLLTVTAAATCAVFDLAAGRLRGLARGEKPLLLAGPRCQLWRGPTDNDGVKAWTGQENKPLGRWLRLGLPDIEHRGVDVRWSRATDGALTVRFVTALYGRPADGKRRRLAEHLHVYRLHPDGTVGVANTVTLAKGVTDIPRVGVQLMLVPALEEFTWFGRGPHENYPDRQAAATVGRWSATATGSFEPYVLPQECGLRCDTRWLAFAGEGSGLLVVGARPLAFSALHHAPQDFTDALHLNDLTARPEVVVQLDAAHRGLGTGACGPDTLEPYRITARRHAFAFALRPYPLRGTDPARLAREIQAGLARIPHGGS